MKINKNNRHNNSFNKTSVKISNKKKVINHMVLQWGGITLLLLTIAVLRYFNYHLYSTGFIAAVFLMVCYAVLKNRFIFEYENSGEVLSIKSYQWPSGGKKYPVFEMPQKRILDVKISNILLQKYLIILFSNSSGKVLKMNIDITFCSAEQVKILFGDITKNLTGNKTQSISDDR